MNVRSGFNFQVRFFIAPGGKIGALENIYYLKYIDIIVFNIYFLVRVRLVQTCLQFKEFTLSN